MRRVVRIHFAMRRVVLLLCAVLQANGFHAAPPPQRPSTLLRPQRPSTLLRASPLSSIPVGSIVLGALAIGSVGDLVVEVPKLGGEGADYIGTLLDAAFLGYATKTLGAQSGLLADAAPATTVEGLELCVSLSVGREDGTWMPKDWAASGARLLLPLDVRFEDEARLIRDLGGVVVRVSHRTRESHESENGTFPCDHELQNHRTVADLHAQVDLLVVATPPPPQPSPLTVDAP